MEIIGVVKDIKYTSLRDEIPPQAFVPYMSDRFLGGMVVYVRTTADPNQLMTAIRSKVRRSNSSTVSRRPFLSQSTK